MWTMTLFLKKAPAKQEDYEKLYRELRSTMQEIVIAHAAACYKHMTPDQLVAVQAEWAKLIKGRGWAPFFADYSLQPAAPRWMPPT